METKENTRKQLFSEMFRAFEKSLGFQNDIKWDNFILITLYHIIGVYWCYHYAFPMKWQTLVFGEYLHKENSIVDFEGTSLCLSESFT